MVQKLLFAYYIAKFDTLNNLNRKTYNLYLISNSSSLPPSNLPETRILSE